MTELASSEPASQPGCLLPLLLPKVTYTSRVDDGLRASSTASFYHHHHRPLIIIITTTLESESKSSSTVEE